MKSNQESRTLSDGPVLGKLIPERENPGRDCVHIAIAPVVAGQDLEPGEPVIIRSGKAEWCDTTKYEAVGIVDPFLTEKVKAGEKFWLLLFQNSITSLRHVWTHPAFRPSVPFPVPQKGGTDGE
jgi:hypothetical protein